MAIAGTEFNPFQTQRSDDLPGFTDSDIAFFGESMGFVTKITPMTELMEQVQYR